MKSIRSIVTGSFFATLIVCGGCAPKMKAQTDTGAVFSVPFSFTADGQKVTAGTYEVRRLENPFLISIRNVDTGWKEIFHVRPEQQTQISSRGTLVFDRCGKQADLTEFHIPGTNLYSAAIVQRHGKKSDLETCSPADAMILAARK